MSQARDFDFEPIQECSVEEYNGRTRPQAAKLTTALELPENLKSRFFESRGIYYFPDRSPAFAEKDGKLTMRTKDLNPEVVTAFISIAENRGWKGLKVTGTKAFRQAVWLEAARRGLEVNGYTPTETEKAWAEQQAKQHNAVMEARDKKRDAELDFEQTRSQSDPERASMLRSADKSTIQKDRRLAKAFAGVSAAWQAAKRRFQDPDQQQIFVAGVQERYAQKLEQGQDIHGPALTRASVIQFKERAGGREDAAPLTEKEQLAKAINEISPPDPQQLFKSRGPSGKLARRLVNGGMTIGEATTAIAFNNFVFIHAPELHTHLQNKKQNVMPSQELAQNYRDRVELVVAGLPSSKKHHIVQTLKTHIAEIDRSMLLREAQQQASMAESPRVNGRRLDTRNPSEFSQFLKSANISNEISSRLIREREELRTKDPLAYAKALQEERKQFEKNDKLSENDRNYQVAGYLAAKSEQTRNERQTEQNRHQATTEKNKDLEQPLQERAPSERSKETERHKTDRFRSEQERNR